VRGGLRALRPSPASLLVYGLTVTLIAFYASSPKTLTVLVALTGVPGLIAGIIKYRLLVALIPFTIIGAFTNAMMLYYAGVIEDPGRILLSLGPIEVPEYAVDSTARIGARILSFAGAGLLLASFVTPRDAVRSLSDELGLPKGASFSLSFALRLLPLLKNDLDDILLVRKLRGHRRIPVTPRDYRSIITPLLASSLERALWVAVAAELRGFALRPTRRAKPRLTLGDCALAAMLAVQIASAAYWG
jgi:energy-coupling factor transport system permease protein